jgi:antirestriction protein ArdC
MVASVQAQAQATPTPVTDPQALRREIEASLRQLASEVDATLAHELLHQGERDRLARLRRPGPRRTHAEQETEADATAYVVMLALGLPSKAPRYIAWQGGTGQVVLRSLRRVQQAAKRILETVEEGQRAR